MTGEDGKPKEPNLYRNTLEHCHDTLLPGCRDTVHEGPGSPAQPIAGPIGEGGWECAEATAWLTELTEHCNGILDAFDDARDVVLRELGRDGGGLPEKDLDANDWRGLNWPRSWSMRQQMS